MYVKLNSFNKTLTCIRPLIKPQIRRNIHTKRCIRIRNGLLNSTVDFVLSFGIGTAACLSLSYTGVKLIIPIENQRLTRNELDMGEEQDEEWIKWSVMTLISCIPFFNWLVIIKLN